MLKNGMIVVGKIASIDEFGNGVINYRKDKVLVRNAILNEKLKVKINKRLKEGYSANIIEIIEASKYRCKANCRIYNECGSCQLMHMSGEGQKAYKLEYIQELVKSYHLNIKVNEIAMMKHSYGYRNKLIIGFRRDIKKGIVAGFYEEFTHRIIPYQSCLLHPKICDEIVQAIVLLMKQFHIEPYDEKTRRGILRHVLIRYGASSKEVLVCFVVNQKVFPHIQNITKKLVQQFDMIKSVVCNINIRKTSVVLGDDEKVVYGNGYIEDELCGLRFRISPKSFYQINHEQCVYLYKRAIDLLSLNGDEVLLDTYCGIGTIGMYASSFVKEVIGVEINKDAISDARANAKLNQVENIHFICDDASSFMVKQTRIRKHIDVVVLDPPRSGSTQEFIHSVGKLKPNKVVYISCNPQTQMRDLKWFEQEGYMVKVLEGVDMFPFTNKVETICLLFKI